MLVLEIQRQRKLVMIRGHFKRPIRGEDDVELGLPENEGVTWFSWYKTQLVS